MTKSKVSSTLDDEKQKKKKHSIQKSDTMEENKTETPKKKHRKRKSQDQADKDDHQSSEKMSKHKSTNKKQKRKQTESMEIRDEQQSEDTESHPEKTKKTHEMQNKDKQTNVKKMKKKQKTKTKKGEGDSPENGDNAEVVQKSEKALEYLTKWKHDRGSWSFRKSLQVWLLQHMYDKNLIADSHFPTLLEYLDGLEGKGRDVTVSKAEEILSNDADKEEEKSIRARQVLQLLT